MDSLTTITLRREGKEEVLELGDFEKRLEDGEVDLFAEVRFPPLTGGAFLRVGEVETFRRLVRPSGIYFERAFHMGRIPFLTLLVCAANLLIFVLQQRAGPLDAGILVAFGAKAGPLIDDLGQIWRLLSANFVHFDLFHIGFNLFVLFHFGAAVENAYRPMDYGRVLIAASLGTTVASYLATNAITMGASGLVYGLMGSAVVFGWRYRRHLPRRHRAVLGTAVVPTVLVFLYMGWTSPGIDNWGHMGGLLAGSATTLFLEPRHLPGAGGRRAMLRAIPLALSLLALAGGSLLLEGRLPRTVRIENQALGLSYSIPRGWQAKSRGTFDNGLPLPAKASVAITMKEGIVDPDLFGIARSWSEEDLERRMEDGRIRKLGAGPILPEEVGGMDAVRRTLDLVVDDAPTELTAVFATRGDRLYSIVLTRPLSLPAYDRVLRAILASVEPLERGRAER